MACDMVAALGQATVGNTTLVGINLHGAAERQPLLKRYPGRHCPPDETILLTHVKLEQVRKICTVLGSQPADLWGLTHGVNEHRVVMGCAGWRSRVEHAEPGLLGSELVRLVLERSHSAPHAVETLTDLIGRHGQGVSADEAGVTDHLFLIADAQEAYVVEAAGKYWAVQECQQARAVSDVALIRQDWCRLAHGLAEHAEQRGWWNNNGRKFDFAGRLALMTPVQPFALKRWGRATLLLEQQNGHLDLGAIRRLLMEHYEDTIVRRRPQINQPAPPLRATFTVEIPARVDEPLIAWVGMGRTGVSFPIALDGELPAHLDGSPFGANTMPHPAWLSDAESSKWHEKLAHQQQRLEEEAEAFAGEYSALKREGNTAGLSRLATSFMQAQAEWLDHRAQAELGRASSFQHRSDLAFVAE